MYFKALVEKSPSYAGWHYVSVPDSTLQDLRKQAAKNGNVPVVIRAKAVVWRTTIMSRGNQQWYAAIKAEVREQLGIKEGDMLDIEIEPDMEKLTKKKVV
tara:strand:- start:500 stop:799 length:300 start_codon:yes stop_codon:yes gene_type:complete